MHSCSRRSAPADLLRAAEAATRAKHSPERLRRGGVWRFVCGLGISVALLVFCGSAQAATFTVDNPGDAGDATLNGACLTAGGVCTLRAAIEESNSDAPSADTITFTAAAQPTINLTGALPDIIGALTISGPGAGALTVRRDSGGAYRIFTITGDVDVAISGMRITNGLSDATTTPASQGGAISFTGTVSCEPFCIAAAAGDGSLSLSAVTVTANTATSIFEAYGGGILVSSGELAIANSTISDNTVSARFDATGGGINAESAVLTDVTVTGNHATSSGDGAGALGGGWSLNGSVEMAGGAITDNTATATSTSSASAVVLGGGARMQGAAAVLTNVAVSGNDATASSDGPATVRGGGIFAERVIFGERVASAEISGSVITDNTASATSTSGAASANGGGADLAGIALATLENVTVSGNDATASGIESAEERGGGVFSYNTAVDLTSATVAFNKAATGANLAVRMASGTVRVRNSIVSDPADGTNCGEAEDGTIISDGFNLSSDDSCGFTAGGDRQSIEPDLGPLANNGGPTLTHALPLSSPAVDQGSAALSGSHPALTTDQRGQARPVEQATVNAAGGDGSDIGAFELEAQTVNAYALAVSTSGSSGQGYVDSSPTGIDCGTFATHTDCANDYTSATPVTLTAHPSAGSTFTGFSGGGCTGTAPCVVMMDQARTVTATFALNQYVLTVATTGSTGQGYVDSSPTGIDCGTFAPHSACSKTYNHGQSVTLTAHASTGSTFTGFSGGGCSGTAPCAVTMDQARTVTATFALNQYVLTVATTGSTGQGYVDSSPTGIDCGTFAPHSACTKTYNHGQSVTLTAHTSTGSTFTGFSGGGCTGAAPCVVTMTQARSVTATFTLKPSYSSVVLADHPAGYWRVAETSGTTALDSSATVPKNNGIYLNGPLLGQTGALAGDTNKAASFDGVNDTLRVPDANSLDVGDSFTLEGWVKRSSSTSSQTLFSKGANGIQLMVMNAPNGNQLWLRKAGVTTVAKSTAAIPGDGRFHHFVVTKNGPSTVFYVDRLPGTTILAPAQVIANTADVLTFADVGSTVHVFDEWALYDGVLGASDVNRHYDAGT
jgi:hypothetical protein